MTYTQEEKPSMETSPKMTQMLKLLIADKDFKAAYFCAQGQGGKYASNEWKDKMSQQRSRNYTQNILELKKTVSKL